MRKAIIKDVSRAENGNYVVKIVELDDVFEICYDVALNSNDAEVVAAALLADSIEETVGHEGYINMNDNGRHLKFYAELPVLFEDHMPPAGKYTVTDVSENENFCLLKLRESYGSLEVPISKYNLSLFEKVLGLDLKKYIAYNHKLEITANTERKSFFVEVSIPILASNNFGAMLRT